MPTSSAAEPPGSCPNLIFWNFLALFAALIISIPGSEASSIRQLHIDDVTEQAEVIFEGVVIDRTSSWNQSHTRISTHITFRVDDVIKGSHRSVTLELTFAGGTVGEATMVYEGLRYPQPGESGIYFVESIRRPLVNPLVGWSQGLYLIDEQGRMMTADLAPINAVQVKASNSQPSEIQLSQGTAQGLLMVERPADAMHKDEFKRQIKRRIDAE